MTLRIRNATLIGAFRIFGGYFGVVAVVADGAGLRHEDGTGHCDYNSEEPEESLTPQRGDTPNLNLLLDSSAEDCGEERDDPMTPRIAPVVLSMLSPPNETSTYKLRTIWHEA